MGAWGAGSFENDTALDWIANIKSIDDVRGPFDRLKTETDAHPDQGAMVIDADFGCELIAAAETVAMIMGREIPDFPKKLKDQIGENAKMDDLLFHQARNAVSHVMRHSELAELWEEGAEDNYENEWLGELTDLIDRLNPDIEFVPMQREDAEKMAGGALENCAFCNQPVAMEEMYSLGVTDYEYTIQSSRNLAIHLRCLNARLHHKHAIQNFKFDPDNMPELDKL